MKAQPVPPPPTTKKLTKPKMLEMEKPIQMQNLWSRAPLQGREADDLPRHSALQSLWGNTQDTVLQAPGPGVTPF